MASQALDGCLHVVEIQVGVIGVLGVARHPELLPYEQAHLIAELEQIVGVGDAATPHADHVHTRLIGIAYLGIRALIGCAEHGLGYPVGATDEDFLSIDIELA